MADNQIVFVLACAEAIGAASRTNKLTITTDFTFQSPFPLFRCGLDGGTGPPDPSEGKRRGRCPCVTFLRQAGIRPLGRCTKIRAEWTWMTICGRWRLDVDRCLRPQPRNNSQPTRIENRRDALH